VILNHCDRLSACGIERHTPHRGNRRRRRSVDHPHPRERTPDLLAHRLAAAVDHHHFERHVIGLRGQCGERSLEIAEAIDAGYDDSQRDVVVPQRRLRTVRTIHCGLTIHP
jgi:hypothetical protein